MRPTLSIITVTFRDPESLRATLESLEALEDQDLPWEQVIVDSSPELNAPVLAGLRARRAFRHVVQEPAGIYSAMNAGISAAQGNLLWFLNGGDRLAAAKPLRSVIAALEEKPAKLFAQAAAELRRDGELLYVQRPRTGLLTHLGINRVCHQAMIYRRSFFESVGLYSTDYRIAADYELHLRAFAKGEQPLQVNEVIASYDMGGQSSNFGLAMEEFARVHDRLAAEGKLPHEALHAFAHSFERARIGAIRKLDQTGLGAKLRRLLHGVRRLRG